MNRCRCVVLDHGRPIYCSTEVHDAPFCDRCETRHPIEVSAFGPAFRVAALPLDRPHPVEEGAS